MPRVSTTFIVSFVSFYVLFISLFLTSHTSVLKQFGLTIFKYGTNSTSTGSPANPTSSAPPALATEYSDPTSYQSFPAFTPVPEPSQYWPSSEPETPTPISEPSSSPSETSVSSQYTSEPPETTPAYDSSSVYPTVSVSSSTTPNYPVSSSIMPQKGYKSVAYFVNWAIYARNYNPWEIPANRLTHVLYAFADNRDDGTVFLTDSWADTDKHNTGDSWNDVGTNIYGCLKQFYILKKANRNLKLLLSIGGWTYTQVSKHLDSPAASDSGRATFAASCVQLIKDNGFDGIDIDWEYPSSVEQGQQFLLLLQATRSAMDAYAATIPGNVKFDLTIAAPAGKQNYQFLPLKGIAGVVDFINLMAYDYSGSWDTCAGYQDNIYPDPSNCTPFSSQTAVDDYIAAGVPADMIILGMPLYGRQFLDTDGPGTNYSGVGEGSWETGIWDYKALPRPGATEYENDTVGASWSYDSKARTMVSYDTVGMAVKKAGWIEKRGLGGAMWWETSGDRNGTESIIENVSVALGGQDGSKLEVQSNNLNYSDSKYDNLRTGCQGCQLA